MGKESKPGPDRTVTDEEIIDVFRTSNDPVLTATEVAEHLPLVRRSVYDRLVNLENNGDLHSKKVGGRTTVWWLQEQTTTRG